MIIGIDTGCYEALCIKLPATRQEKFVPVGCIDLHVGIQIA